MRKLRFLVNGQTIKPDPSCDFSGIVANSVGYLCAEFKLDSAWTGCQVAASFWNGKNEHAALLQKGVCEIPSKALVNRELVGVSLVGVKDNYKIATNKIYFKQEVR